MTVENEDIARRAYQLWQQRGCPAGSAEADWYEAELQLASGAATTAVPKANLDQQASVDQSVDASFPASDAPSSHVPDKPPSNARAKWEAAKTTRARGR